MLARMFRLALAFLIQGLASKPGQPCIVEAKKLPLLDQNKEAPAGSKLNCLGKESQT